MAIYAYSPTTTNFATNGLGELMPESCTVTEEANGMYEAELTQPIVSLVDGLRDKWEMLQDDVILSIPVPVRTLPQILAGPTVANVFERWKVIAETVPMHTQNSQSSDTIREIPKDEIWTMTSRSGNWLSGRDKNGTSGWVEAMGLEYVEEIITDASTSAIERVVPAAFARQQLFRVYRVAWTDDQVTVTARHISYDFGKNLIANCDFAFVNGYTALRLLISNLYMPAGKFSCHTDVTARPDVDTDLQTVNWTRLNPIEALLDPDIGFCKLYSAEMVRDNYDIYLLRSAGLDRGYRIAYGKNMTGIDWERDKEEVITRFVPIGQDENGAPLLLPEVFVDSSRINDYPVIYAAPLDVMDATVGSEDGEGKEITRSAAYKMMRDAAKREISNGADTPTVSVTVNFINLGDTEEFAQFKQLSQVYLHDIVYIEHAKLKSTFAAQVVKTVWDAVMQRYTGIEISTKLPSRLVRATVSSWQISGGISGAKLRAGTVTLSQLSQNVISASAITDMLPVGTWLPYSGASPPSSKWLFAEGQVLDANTYPDAHATFGGVLPDARGKTLVHMDARDADFSTLHKTIGSKDIQVDVTDIPMGSGEAMAVLAPIDGILPSAMQPSLVVRYIVKVLP